eukprot:TRINITY_DN24035_c0_g1_i1.p2 TRINITY_DN24035_c0_g1~~TRINITY_DN24035_c0_g1_i1.p2  ORF type:complete len:214 (+),score=70.96 TRINITY_DN24035_c0_g1_i1:81-644(+)
MAPQACQEMEDSAASWDSVAAETGQAAFIAAFIWVILLEYLINYDPTAFGENSGLHDAFVVTIAVGIGAGGAGLLLLCAYYNCLKLMGFQLRKRGSYTDDQVKHFREAAKSMEYWAYPGRILTLYLSFPAFLVAAGLYFFAKVRFGPLGGKGEAIAGTVIVSALLLVAVTGIARISQKFRTHGQRAR